MFAVVPMSAWPASIWVSLRLPLARRNSVSPVWRISCIGLCGSPARSRHLPHQRCIAVDESGFARAAVELGAQLLWVEQELVRLRLALENVPLQLESQILVDDRQVARLSALAVHSHLAAVEVLELEAGELALAEREPA